MAPLSLAALALALLLGPPRAADAMGIIIRDPETERYAEDRLPPESAMLAAEHLPRDFSWRSVHGIGSLLTVGGNQHIPHYCGACYAFGSMHTLQDRIKIARYLMDNAGRLGVSVDEAKHGPKSSHAPLRSPDFIAAVQVLLNCYNDKACHGGSTASAWAWAKNFQGGGVPVQGCMAYEAIEGRGCSAVDICQNCMGTVDFTVAAPKYECWAVPADMPVGVGCFGPMVCEVAPYPRLGVADHGKVEHYSPDAMMREIASRGPIACAIDAMSLLPFGVAGNANAVIEDEPSLHAAKELARAAAALPRGYGHAKDRPDSKNATDHIVEVGGGRSSRAQCAV